MQTLFKKRWTRYSDPHDKRTQASSAKDANGKLRIGYKHKIVRSKLYYGRYRDEIGVVREVSLSRDKDASLAKLLELKRRAERLSAGLSHFSYEYLSKPIIDQVDAYQLHMEAKGDSSKHVKQTISRIKNVVAADRYADFHA